MLSGANTMPSEVEIVIVETSPALEETVGEALKTLLRTEENICRKDQDNELVRTDVGLISDGIDCLEAIPDCYIRPPSERPRLNEVPFADFIPVVDLDNFSVAARKRAISNIRDACQQYGFFQIVNHGVHETVIQRMLEVAREFFTMPAEYRADLHSEDPSRVVRLSSSFNIREEIVFNWRNYLRLHCYPLEDYIDYWPTKPSAYREVASKYCIDVRAMTLRLLDVMSESLGLEPDFLNKALGKHGQHMAINYYPRCPNPELTYGLPSHTDPNALTVLLQDQVSGLQVLNNGNWIAVQPIANSFVINIGDQLQVLSNGLYKSTIHRAVVNSSVSRLSIASFYCPSNDAMIEPASSLINPHYPARYGKFTYEEYYRKFWSKNLDGRTCLDLFSVNDANRLIKDEIIGQDLNP